MTTSLGQSAWTNLRPLMSTRRLKCLRESAPRRGTETGANLKFQVKILESEPQENLSVIRRDPLQNIEDTSAVSKRVPSVEDDRGLGNTETEAPESTRNSRLERISCTYKTKLQMNRQDGRRNRFPRRNRVLCSWRRSYHACYGTSRIRKKLKNWRTELENARESGFEPENVWEAISWRGRSGEKTWRG